MKKNISKNKGFTLIELLVVIGIIALLSSIVLSSLTQARAKANNTKQIADYKTVIGAMIQFKNSNGYYPAINTFSCVGIYSSGGCLNSDSITAPDSTINNALKTYISSYNFVDSKSLVAQPFLGNSILTNYNGFMVKCSTNSSYGQCQSIMIMFPALKNTNSCPTLISDANAIDTLSNPISDYTLCRVDLN